MTAFARLRNSMFVLATFYGFASVMPPAVHAQFLDRKALKQSQDQQAAQRAAIAQMLARSGAGNSAQMEAEMLDDASAAQPKSAAVAAPKVGPKQAGVVRVGIVLPANRMSGQGQLADGEPVRAAQLELVHGPKLEAVKLTALVPAQAMEEAKLLDCDYVLTSTITQQETAPGGKFGRFANMRTLHMATTAAQFIPGVQGAAMMANMLAGPLLAEGLQSASRGVKANSDVTLEYTLTDKNGNVKLQDQEKVHSRSDAENVLTPMLSNAATKIVAAVAN